MHPVSIDPNNEKYDEKRCCRCVRRGLLWSLVRCLRPEDDASGEADQEGAAGTSEESPQGASNSSSDVQLTNDTRSTLALEVLDERHSISLSGQQLGAIRRGRSSSAGDSDIGIEDQSKRASLNSEASGDYFYDEPTLSPVRTGAQAIASSAGLDLSLIHI